MSRLFPCQGIGGAEVPLRVVAADRPARRVADAVLTGALRAGAV